MAIQACSTEREIEMLLLLVRALRSHGCPDTLYVDYVSGHIISTMV